MSVNKHFKLISQLKIKGFNQPVKTNTDYLLARYNALNVQQQ